MTDWPERDPSIIEEVLVKDFGFTPDQFSRCHARFWYTYETEAYFRFMELRNLVKEFWEDALVFKPEVTTCRLHRMVGNEHREFYTMMHDEVAVTIMLQDNHSALVRSQDKHMTKYIEDTGRITRLLLWYRRRAVEKGAYAVDRAIQVLIKLIMNLPAESAVWVVPDSEQKLLVAQVIWKNAPHREALTLTVNAPKHHIF